MYHHTWLDISTPPTAEAWEGFPEAAREQVGRGREATVSPRRPQASRQPRANRCPPLLQGISVAVSGMHRGEEVRFGPIHSPELPHERVLPQLLLCQHPLLQPLLQIPKPQGLPQVFPEPIHLLWEEVSAVWTLALQHFPPLGAVKVKTGMSVDHGWGGVTQT